MRLSHRVPSPLALVHHVIADVVAYPLFVPGVKKAVIIGHNNDVFDADLDVVILGKTHTYRSRVYVESNCVKANATTIMGHIHVGWHLREANSLTHVDFHLTTTIPAFDWLMPKQWPLRIMQAFLKRCADLDQ